MQLLLHALIPGMLFKLATPYVAATAASVIVVTGFVGRYGTEPLAGYGLGTRMELMLVPRLPSSWARILAPANLLVPVRSHGPEPRLRSSSLAGEEPRSLWCHRCG
jgi:hypothetical protein